jgi:SMODS and SLOG-associating 2TM effector domain 3/SMODS and SLOG-associating 2TM effector domain 1
MRIGDNDLPALFRAADKASTDAQSRYLLLIGLDLGLLVVGAILGATSFNSEEVRSELAIASAIVFGLSLILTIALKSQRLASAWYDGRAVAESVKTTAWRYMTQADPYDARASEPEADHVFTDAVASFLSERANLAANLPAYLATGAQITPAMKAVRGLSTAHRRDLYLEERIGGQRRWYAERAEMNKKGARRLFVFVLVSQGLALIAAIFIVRWPLFPMNLVGVFAAVGAALLAWNQLKRYEEIATAYGLAAQELGTAQEQGRHVQDDEHLSSFVLNAENAISREHTLWLARRNYY